MKNITAGNSNTWHNGGVGTNLTGMDIFNNFGYCLTRSCYKYRHFCKQQNVNQLQ